LGATLKPTKSLAISAVGNNVNNPGHGFLPTSFGGGVGLALDTFSLEADMLADFTSWDSTKVRGMGGAELLVADRVPIQLGYRYDQGAKSHALSGGLGYLDRALEVNLALRRTVSGDAATAVVFDFIYHLESTGLTPSGGESF